MGPERLLDSPRGDAGRSSPAPPAARGCPGRARSPGVGGWPRQGAGPGPQAPAGVAGGNRPGCQRDGGFTLLEVLVAAVIAGLALAVLFRGAAGSVEAARVAAHVQEATSRARSRLSALEGAEPVPGEQAGDDGGGYRWRTRVASVERGGGFALFDLDVQIAWSLDGGERRVELRSRRMAPAPPEPP